MTSSLVTDSADLAFEQLCGIANRLNEPIDGCASFVTASAKAPTSAIVYNLLLKVRSLVKHATPPIEIKYQLKPASNGSEVLVVINKVPSLTAAQHAALRQLSPRIHTIRFQFRTLDTADPLGYGCMVFAIKLQPLESAEQWRALFRQPPQRQRMCATPDWTLTVVRNNDRGLVLAVIDDVYNMTEFMPTDMCVSLEPIEDVNYQTHTAASRKRGALASETDDESSAAHGNVIGYALHFTDVPSFDDAFIAYLSNKYESRWVGFALVFPHMRQRGNGSGVRVPQRFVVEISTETAPLGAAQAHATKGARRLVRKLHAVVS